jgi:poly-gamma-glutamate synthesis protein (capsule biosynthesis protein)
LIWPRLVVGQRGSRANRLCCRGAERAGEKSGDGAKLSYDQKLKKKMEPDAAKSISVFLCGDVMTGRGIDQVLPHPGGPVLYESYVRDARDYVSLAERANGAIPRPVSFSYIWGDGLRELEQAGADVRIVNLETSITCSEDFWPGKGIHYRMHPQNIGCLTAARLSGCSLANNHVLDWGYEGLAETLQRQC